MNLSKKMQAAFNAQITAELYSSNLYLQMAFWLRKEGWKGFAAWMFDHSNEEKEHALKMADFVLNRGGECFVSTIDQPDLRAHPGARAVGNRKNQRTGRCGRR